MALQSPSHPMFAQVPDEFFSPFPSNDSLLSGKYQALTHASYRLSEDLATMQQAKAFNITLQILQKTRATKAGDLLTDWLPEIAWFKEDAGVKLLQGIFAEVPWSITSDPQQLMEDMGRVGLDVALTAMAAVPIYGTIASALVSGGRLLYRLMAAREDKVLALPWAEYSKDTDEEIYARLRDDVFPRFDWTNVFMPPFDDTPWKIGEAKDKGLVFGPLRSGEKELAWSANYGCMPGTVRVAGQTQSIATPPGNIPDGLARYLRHPKGVTPKAVQMDWHSTVIACGDYFPSLAQVGAVTWQQCMRAGAPVMYCLDADAIDSAWKNYWDNFYASAWDVYRNAGPLLKIPPFMQFLATRIASELIEPYICVRRTPTSPWQLGIPFGAFRPNALVHPGIFKQGPAEKEFRNPCAWVETDTARKKDHPDWPYGGKPDQHSSLRGTRYATTTSPATTKPPPDGYRCMPWPAPEAAAAEYAPVYETLREARALASLSHPAIVEYVDHGVTDEGQAFLVMERLIGEDLQTRLQRGTLPIQECIELGILLTDALVAAHAQGMVHRDIKPSNIFLDNGKVGNARLLDFGVARTSDDAHSLTRTGTMLGTVGYMSPEQARGDPDIDGRADLYSLGSVLYECLTGQQVFSGEHAMAVLAKILLDAPSQVSALRPEVSPPLAALIDALLAKDRESRPGCASALLTLLSGLDPGHEGENAGSRVPGGSGVTLEEQRVYCLLLVRLRPIQLDERGATNADVHTQYAAIASIAADFGAVFSPMLGGMGLLSVQIDAPATDVALQAARCALTLRNQFPAIAQCLATGRGQRQGASFVGRLIDTAMAVEGQALAGAVLVDAATVSLLQDRFTLEGSDDRTFLGVERDVLVTRMLLGRPAPFVGRARELGLLQGLVYEAIEESQSCAALIIAGPGYGKSRLRHELHRSLREEGLDLLTLVGRGSPMAQGAALSVLRDAIRREVGSFDGPVSEQRERLRRRVGEALPATERDRVAAFLGELAGIPADSNAYAKLALARNDALVMVDAMRVAWLDWLRAECRRRPVLLIVEDLHWGDAATVAFIDAALRDLRGSPFIVLALARPEVQGVFPRVWSASRPTILELTPISQRAGEALARQVLGPATNEATVAALVLHADGNPFFLEELLRAVASGASTTLPDSVLGVIQDRLQALDDESRRVLRAASVFGGGFTEGAVAAVLAQRTHPVRARLATLVEQELISREFRADKAYYRFRHALVRDASHAMLTDADRTLAHRLAAGWLADQEGHEPMVVAEHFRLGDCRPEAVLWFHRAAEQALDGGDLAATVDRADEAIACGAEGATLSDLRLLQAEARIWSGSLEQAERWAGEAIEGLRAGSLRWYIALQKAIYCASVRGALDAALVWVDQAEQQQADDDAQVGPLLCLCEATLAMHVAGRPELTDGLLARVEQHASRIALPPGYLGHVFRARAIVRGATGRYEETHTEAQRAVAEFTAAGDLRSAARMGVFAAHAIILLGAYEEAEQLLRAVDASATRLDAEQVLIYCRGTLGWLLSLTSRPAEGRALLRDVLALCEHRGDPRAEGVFGIHLGVLDACDGDIAGAEVRITRGLQLVTGQMQIVPWGQASLARVYLAAGRTAEASALAAAILDLLTASDVYVNQEAFVLATVLDCLHEESAARHAAIGLAAQRIRRNLANIISPARRRQFLAIPDCTSLIEIARRAGLMVDDLLAERYEE